MVLSLWKFSGAHEAGGDQFADFEFEPTRPLGSKAPNWHCCPPIFAAIRNDPPSDDLV